MNGPDLVTFETDFGARFGMLICFDIVYDHPALTLYYKYGIRHFVFSTAWVDELPFHTGFEPLIIRNENQHLPA